MGDITIGGSGGTVGALEKGSEQEADAVASAADASPTPSPAPTEVPAAFARAFADDFEDSDQTALAQAQVTPPASSDDQSLVQGLGGATPGAPGQGPSGGGRSPLDSLVSAAN